MRWIDMHCDTLSELERGKGTLFENSLCVDIKRLEQSGALAQFFACFTDAGKPAEAGSEKQRGKQGEKERWEAAYDKVNRLLDRALKEEIIAGENFCFAGTEEELERAASKGRIAGILTVEEGGVLNGKIERLKELYDRKVRLITLTWNYENCIGSPNSRDYNIMRKGLTGFGKQVVEQMNEMGMIVDVSHLSDGGFWDCIDISKKPVAASHSNARALCGHPRNLSDEMLRALGENGGVAGVNFYSAFLKGRQAPDGEKERAQIGDIVRHIIRVMDKAGEEAAALGTDFDGFGREALPENIRGAEDMEKLWQALETAGATQRQIDRIASGNVRRVLRDVCG